MLAQEILREHIEGKLTYPSQYSVHTAYKLALAEAKNLLLHAHNEPTIINLILDRLTTLVCLYFCHIAI